MNKEKDILFLNRRQLLSEVAPIEARQEEIGSPVKKKKGHGEGNKEAA